MVRKNVEFNLKAKAGNQESDEVSANSDLPINESIIDVDGNLYSTVQIGTQYWMAENLKAMHYNNGDEIELRSTDNTQWFLAGGGAFCYYNNDQIFEQYYGKIYNWYAVTDSRKICPSGWQIPSDSDFNELIAFLGGSGVAGDKLKLSGNEYWAISVGSNEYGFSAMPGGYRATDGNFDGLNHAAYFWSSKIDNQSNSAFYLALTEAPYAYLYSSSPNFGCSVRCLKN